MFWVVVLPSGAHGIIWFSHELILGLGNAGEHGETGSWLRLIAGRRLYVVGMYAGVQDQVVIVGQQCVVMLQSCECSEGVRDLAVLILQSFRSLR